MQDGGAVRAQVQISRGSGISFAPSPTRLAHLLLLSGHTLFVPALLLLFQLDVALLHLIHLLPLPLQALLLYFLLLPINSLLLLLLLNVSIIT